MVNKKTLLYLAILCVSFLPFLLNSQGGMSSLNTSLGGLCAGIRTILPVAAMIGVVGSGATYVAGQFMGAETRARAVVWATSMLVGSAVAVLVVVVAPPVLSTVYGTSGFACNGTLSGGQGTSCGGSGQVCCSPGNTCNAGLSCSGGVCTGIVTCGGSGQPCCGGTTCNAGLSCLGGVCSAAACAGNPCASTFECCTVPPSATPCCRDDIYACGNTCFLPGTQISTPNGYIAIESIAENDTVFAFDENTIVTTHVQKLIKSYRDHHYTIKTDVSEVNATAEHPFYTGDNSFTKVSDLKVGQTLFVLENGKLEPHAITEIKLVEEQTAVYNLAVGEPNTFFANGFAVHNKAYGCAP